MRLTTKGRFAVTAVLDLSTRQSKGPIALADISARQQISLSYLEQLFGKLRRAGIVASTRGPGGGYTLARLPADLSVADIIVAVDEPLDTTQCSGKENCTDEQAKCLTHDLWQGLNEHIIVYLQGIKLADLIADFQRREREAAAAGPARVIEMHARPAPLPVSAA